MRLEGSVRAERVRSPMTPCRTRSTCSAERDRAGRMTSRSTKSRRGCRRNSCCRTACSRTAAVLQRAGRQRPLDGTHSLRSKSLSLAGEVLLERDRVADEDGIQELVVEADRSVVQKERRRHPTGHKCCGHAGPAEGRPRNRQDAARSDRTGVVLAANPTDRTTNAPVLSERRRHSPPDTADRRYGIGTMPDRRCQTAGRCRRGRSVRRR